MKKMIAAWRERLSPRLCLALAVWLGAVAAVLLPVNYLYGMDGYFHVRVAQEMWARGPFFRDFHAATESIWLTAYFDKDWLFHVFLMPFVRFGDGIGGAKLAILAMNGLVAGAFWYFCRTLGLRQRLAATLILPFVTLPFFLERLVLCRSYLPALALLLLALSFMLRRRPWWLGVAAMVYAVTHTGHWQLLGLAMVYDAAWMFLTPAGGWRGRPRGRPVMTLAVLLGIMAGEYLHPQFPHNLEGLWIQNVLIPRAYTGTIANLFKDRPAELRPWAAGEFFATLGPLIGGFALAALHAAVNRFRPCRRTLIVAAWTGVYVVLTLRLASFAQYLPPLAVALLALYWQRQRLGDHLPPRTTRVLATVVIVVLALANLFWIWNFTILPRRQFGGNRPEYTDAARTIREHADPGEIVFTTGWSEPPELWFLCPEQRFLIFLDPYFFYYRDADRYDLWMRVSHGHEEDPVGIIRDVFGSRLVFTVQRPDRQRIARQLRAAPGVEVLYDSIGGPVVFRLPPAGDG